MQFERLLPRFEALWKARYEGRTVTGETRRRKRGGGHWSVLASTRAKLFFIMFHARFRPSQEVMALIFGLSQGQVSHWISRLNPLAAKVLGNELPAVPRRPAKLAQLFQDVPGLLDIIKELSVADDRLPPNQPVRPEKREPSESKLTRTFLSAEAMCDGAETWELDGRRA